ncbi:hypothetical protein MMC13_000842 [Lambiella insularis]|nr:hypothetical protein [Lambiella insularis]
MATATRRPATAAPKPPTSLASNCVIAETASLTGSKMVTIAANTILHPRAMIVTTHSPVMLGEGCIICERASIGQLTAEAHGNSRDVVLDRNVVVEAGAVVEAEFVGEGTIVELGAKVGRGAVLGKIYARDAEPFEADDEHIMLVARDLVSKIYARAHSPASSSGSSSGLFAAPLGSHAAPAHTGGFSPQSPGLGSHFTYTGAYTLDQNGGRRHSTGSSAAVGGGRPAPPARAKTWRRRSVDFAPEE